MNSSSPDSGSSRNTFFISEALDYYKKFIYSEERQGLLSQHGLRVAGSVPSIDWELFGSILTGDLGKPGYGSDLQGYEIKSSIEASSFEYQYHLRGGKQKLIEDAEVKHLFISYSSDYKNVIVRLVEGKELKDIFESWMPGLVENYEGATRKQRYRKSIPYGLVAKVGKVIMTIKNGELVENQDLPILQ